MNINAIRQKVARAISKAPLNITVYRANLVDDGCGGYITPPGNESVIVGKIQGILDNSGKSMPKLYVGPGGQVSSVCSDTFITIWQEGITFKPNDFFESNGDKYQIVNAVNVLDLNIYWQLELKKIL